MTIAAGAGLRVQASFPATSFGGMMLVQHVMPVLEPFFVEAARVEGGRWVWVVELPDGVGVGAKVLGYDVQLRADAGHLVVVLPRGVAAGVAVQARGRGVPVAVRADPAGGAIVLPAGGIEVVVPMVGVLTLRSA